MQQQDTTPPPGYVEAPFRIAIRQEGPTVNAYLAPNESMDEKALLCSVDRRLIDVAGGLDGPVFAAFRELAQACAVTWCKEATGVEPAFAGYREAPEHERSGHG